ncbi:hypothetical protein FC093_04785 [Ilyomonas limi]|uniref:Uncharacterized protein n=1 Tax=Ilyomonas limi TaxID=2575867 RepID=A0A4U3L6W9_9BACT|nr:hypothetical protein [Ilyomonas limi]TKK70998.1 hypothetical protein FC093_04785 [Ilyomonas limi]
MDKRDTFKDYQQLLSIFLNLQEQQQQAALLIDDEGLTRIEGKITNVEQSEDIGKSTIAIDNKEAVILEHIIAVNGLFRDDYSEC